MFAKTLMAVGQHCVETEEKRLREWNHSRRNNGNLAESGDKCSFQQQH